MGHAPFTPHAPFAALFGGGRALRCRFAPASPPQGSAHGGAERPGLLQLLRSDTRGEGASRGALALRGTPAPLGAPGLRGEVCVVQRAPISRDAAPGAPPPGERISEGVTPARGGAQRRMRARPPPKQAASRVSGSVRGVSYTPTQPRTSPRTSATREIRSPGGESAPAPCRPCRRDAWSSCACAGAWRSAHDAGP